MFAACQQMENTLPSVANLRDQPGYRCHLNASSLEKPWEFYRSRRIHRKIQTDTFTALCTECSWKPINFLYVWVHHTEIVFHQLIPNQLFKLLSCENVAESFLELLLNSHEGPERRSQETCCFEGPRACCWAFSRFGHSKSSSHLCYLHSCECHVKTLDGYSLFCLTILL